MNIRRMLGLGWGCLAAAWAYGQATLPAFYSGPWYGTTLPTGWTQSGLGTDYASNYDQVGGNAAKFDNSGDWLQIFFNAPPTTVSYFTQGNQLSGAYVYKVQQSTNGTTWTDVVVYDGTTNPISSSIVGRTNTLASASRYVRFIYVTKVSGNVGLDGVLISGLGPPAVTFTPSGPQSVAVSNELTLLVSVSPPGSGTQSWNIATGYVGTASLTNGVFSMTPAGGDSGKTFTLSVIATNTVGTSTGQVNITVTPYVPPLPTITFSPAGPYSIMATETQRLGIGISPAGSGIASWTLVPSNYAGTAGVSGTNFTFITAQSDGPETYTFTVVATNANGSTTNATNIIVTAYVPAPPPGSVVVDFEDAPSKTTYAPATNTLSGRPWLVGGVIGTLEQDKKFGAKALRIRANAGDNEIKLASLTAFSNGIDSISLWYASYGNDGTNNLPKVSIQISTNLNTGWITLTTFDTGSAVVLTPVSVEVKVSEPVFFRLWAPQAGTDKRANIDNIVIAPYVAPTGYEAYLLQYNVTPGDPGAGPFEDYDGDGFSNTNEFTAGSNPYDPASTP